MTYYDEKGTPTTNAAPPATWVVPVQPAISLRDWLAGMMASALVQSATMIRHGVIYQPKTVAANAYALADAMLKAREPSND